MMLSEHKGALALSGCLFARPGLPGGSSDRKKRARRTVPLAPSGSPFFLYSADDTPSSIQS